MDTYEIVGFCFLFVFFYLIVPIFVGFVVTGKMLQRQQREQQNKNRRKARRKVIEDNYYSTQCLLEGEKKR